MDTHVLSVTGSKSRIVESARVGSVQIVEKYWVDNLFDRNTTNIFGRQK